MYFNAFSNVNSTTKMTNLLFFFRLPALRTRSRSKSLIGTSSGPPNLWEQLRWTFVMSNWCCPMST